MKKIVICGGHLTPALSLLDELIKNKDVEVLFFGRKYATEGSKNLSAEFKTISKLNIKFYELTAGRFQRKFTKYTIPALFKVPIGFIQSLIYLITTRPNIIVSFGGYLSLPIVFSGWLIGITSITHEQSTKAGLASKINALFVKRIFLTWPQTQKYFPRGKTEVIGNLTRKTIFNKRAKNPNIRNFLTKSQKLILIIGGNQGSHFLNQKIFELLPKLSKYNIFHQVGTANCDGDLDKAGKIKRSNYFFADYIYPQDIGAVLNRADLIISRSGANTVWDLALLAKVAILIPLPISSSGEQQKNAETLQSAGSAVIVDQNDGSPDRLQIEIKKVFTNIKGFQKSAQIFSTTLPNEASAKLVGYIN